MAEHESPPDTSAAIKVADAAYRPIPEFVEWSEVTLDSDIWQRYSEMLRSERDAAAPEAIQRATTTALRAAAVETGAIEGLYDTDRGFTLSVATQAAGWEVAFDERGADARALFEAQLQAFEMVLDVAAANRPVSEAWIRQLHEVLCGPQKIYRALTSVGFQELPLPKGKYKEHPNHVNLGEGRMHSYAPVDAVTPEMARLIQHLSSPQFMDAHPLLQAAYSHFALVAIHPFADGNGRVARALASVFLYRAASIPLLIYADQKASYFSALEIADGGAPKEFVDFVFDRAVDTVGEVSLVLQAERMGPPDEAISNIQGLYEGYGGLSHSELDAVAARLSGLINGEVEAFLSQHRPEIEGFQGLVRVMSGSVPSNDPGYRPAVNSPKHIRVALGTPAPAGAVLQRDVQVLVAREKSARFAFRVFIRERPNELPFEIRLQDIYPSETLSLRNRVAIWVRNFMTQALVELSRTAETNYRGQGY